MISYWNQKYFEGLYEIGNTYAQRHGLEQFGDYCLKKSAGQKKEANRLSINFVSDVLNRNIDDVREVVVHICELDHAHPEVHSIINHHLSILIQETLYIWSENEPTLVTPHRWEALYGRYERQDRALEIALAIDPNDQLVLEKKCNLIISDLEFMTHHLSENILLGEIATGKSSLLELRPLIKRLSNPEMKNRKESELDYFSELFSLWEEYQRERSDENFLSWAKEKANFIW